jgi:hypothetical protein
VIDTSADRVDLHLTLMLSKVLNREPPKICRSHHPSR